MKQLKSLSIISLVLAAGLLSACQIAMIRGSGHVITDKRNVSGFNAVSFSGIGEINLTQGESESLTIEAEDNIAPHFITEVKNNTLYIHEDQSATRSWLQPTRPVRFNLSVKNLNAFDLLGVGNIRSASLKADSLSISINGAGSIHLDRLDANALTANINGTGDVDIAGKVDQQNTHLSGTGSYRTPDLQSQSAAVDISGAGSATVWAQESLTAHISGAGTVAYYGHPQVNQSISGVGSIKGLGNK